MKPLDLYQKEVEEFRQRWRTANHFEVMTSGSTGAPKIIEHSKESMISSAQMTIDRFGLCPSDTLLVCLPIKFIAGMMMLVRAEVLGADLLTIVPSINPLQYLDRRVSFAALTPLQLEQALDHCPDKIRLIDQMIIGGAPISRDLLQRIWNVQAPTEFYHTYGMTETITHIAIKDLKKSGYTGLFEALPDVTFSQTEDGRLVISAQHLSLSPLFTNDIVELVNDHSFRWIERSDDVINSGGMKIFPTELEKLIDDYVDQDFFVSSLAHNQLGQQVILIIVDPLEEVDMEALLTKLKVVLPKNHEPKQIVRIPELLKTPTGKIIKDYKRYISE